MKVVLIGDSIRMGYQPIVADILAGEADVWGPEANGGTSANVRANLNAWGIERPADVIHINAGLHDLRRPFDAAANEIPVETYRANVRAILTALTQRTDARVIWATTTPVHHERHHRTKGFDRFEEDVVAYNAAAAEEAATFGVAIDDLYAVVMSAGRDALLVADGVHFTEDGYRLLAAHVVEAVRP